MRPPNQNPTHKFQFATAIPGERGTQYIVTPTTLKIFRKYVRPHMRPEYQDYRQFISEWPDDHVLLLRQPGEGWKVVQGNDYDVLMDYLADRQQYWIEVKDFNSPSARQWSKQLMNPSSKPRNSFTVLLGLLGLLGISVLLHDR